VGRHDTPGRSRRPAGWTVVSRATVVIGGGTKVNTSVSAAPVGVVDLQSLDLDRIEPIGLAHLSIGATATLQAITEDIRVPDAIRAAAHHDAPNTLRNAATVGGCVAARDAASELLAALLVHGACIILAGPTGDETTELGMVLGDPGAWWAASSLPSWSRPAG